MIENVILDLDHTLIHSPEKIPAYAKSYLGYYRYHHIILDGKVYLIFERPFLREFLRSLRGKRIAIWTAADKNYANFIVNYIIKPYLYPDQKIFFVWDRDVCDESSAKTGVIKNLNLVFEKYPWFKRENTLIIDDNPDLLKQDNMVHIIKKFEMTDPDDAELLKFI